MHAIITTLIATIPTVLTRIAARAISEKLVEWVMVRLIKWALRELVKLSTNTVDDEIAAEVIKAIDPPKPETEEVPEWWGKSQ